MSTVKELLLYPLVEVRLVQTSQGRNITIIRRKRKLAELLETIIPTIITEQDSTLMLNK